MKLWKIAAIVGGGTLCVVTGGLAAPAVGTVVGGAMGLSGAAATSAGLAALGGGSLAAGGLGMAGGTTVISAVAGGIGAVGAAAGTAVAVEGIEEGVKKAVRRSPIYKMGESEGKKAGYTRASREYENKLLRQAQSFEEQKKLLKIDEEEYNNLLDEYEKYIENQ